MLGLKSGMNEDLIIGALKEATYNGVSNLRYIDKIIYEWGKKGFKNMNDVNNHLNKEKMKKMLLKNQKYYLIIIG
jgi:DNA replication protein DnaD